MNYLNKMYGNNKIQPSTESNKNPNRVTGGLKAQGSDRLTMIAEDGSSQELPSLSYVRSLEEQSKKQRAAITVLERKLSRHETVIERLISLVNKKN